jgi:hypothetical protein
MPPSQPMQPQPPQGPPPPPAPGTVQPPPPPQPQQQAWSDSRSPAAGKLFGAGYGSGAPGGAGGQLDRGWSQGARNARRNGAEHMTAEEVDYIMRIMYAALHSGHPYAEDFYYQAHVNKYQAARNARCGLHTLHVACTSGDMLLRATQLQHLGSPQPGACCMHHAHGPQCYPCTPILLTPCPSPPPPATSRRGFAPERLRDLGALEKDMAGPDAPPLARHADLRGLGKFVLSNLRTPKVLMDVSSLAAGAGGEEGPDGQQPVRRLEQEPLLAARMMVEDCVALLLDVDDIDRLFAAAQAERHDEDYLRRWGDAEGGVPGGVMCVVQCGDCTRAWTKHAFHAVFTPRAAVQRCMFNPLGCCSKCACHMQHHEGASQCCRAYICSDTSQLAMLTHACPRPCPRRRALLVDTIASLFKLPAAGADDDMAVDSGAGVAASEQVGDSIFLRIIELPKGRALLAKYFRALLPPPANWAKLEPEQQAAQQQLAPACMAVLLAVLRNARRMFGPAMAPAEQQAGNDGRMVAATQKLAAATSELLKRLGSSGVLCQALGALCSACGMATAAGGSSKEVAEQLLPLFPANRLPSDANPDWLGSLAAALLLRGSELGLEPGSASSNGIGTLAALVDGVSADAMQEDAPQQDAGFGAVCALWQQRAQHLAGSVLQHLQLLLALRESDPGCKPLLPALACVPLVRVLVQHCGAEQAEPLKQALHNLTV